MKASSPPDLLKSQTLQNLSPTSPQSKVSQTNWFNIAATIVALIALSDLDRLYNQNTGLKDKSV